MNFAAKGTGSQGKLKATKWAEKNSRCFGKGLCVYLVGSPFGLQRHIEDKKRLGFTDLSKHVIVENHLATYEALKDAVAALNLPIRVIFGDFYDVCKKLKWVYIKHLDFDTNAAFSEYDVKLVAKAVQWKVTNIHVVNSSRGNPAYLTQKCAEMGISSVRKQKGVVGPPVLKDLLPKILSHEGYHTSCFGYKGAGGGAHGGTPMTMTVLQKDVKCTAAHIAKASGYCLTTVRAVLQHSTLVPIANNTRIKILSIAKQLNWNDSRGEWMRRFRATPEGHLHSKKVSGAVKLHLEKRLKRN